MKFSASDFIISRNLYFQENNFEYNGFHLLSDFQIFTVKQELCEKMFDLL